MDQARKCVACTREVLEVLNKYELNGEEVMAVLMGIVQMSDELYSQHGISKGTFIKAIKTGCEKVIEELKNESKR
ncbi:hypothetical protein [Hydrogenimonas thermophila]|uniref:Uncharacterized protein n=1 Tax=Hydrogenimonas thermophila TaxID=223786 RepID=A0A1I5RSG7_9BACT|nr:hypothetical protein [Hydrogenimonas thermophila]SFP61465.1 hypothetical protein SAMN05216234_12840 [Hydrogenimonas thermophila]